MNKILLILSLICVPFLQAVNHDSVGLKVVNGKTFILHKVVKGEGVYSISKKYGVAASDIYSNNPGSEKSIMIGQVLMIPKSGLSVPKGSPDQGSQSKTDKVYHTVAKGQTLSSIAKLYNISVAKLKEMNNLTGDNIRLGQKLLVSEKKAPAQTPVPKAPAPDPVVTPSNTTPPAQTTQKPADQSSNTTPASPSTPAKPSPAAVNASYDTDDGDEVNESGIAIVSTEGDLGQDRSFILHPTARIGTIVMITNPANGTTVFARVIGNCKAESGVVLKMSKTVANKLGVSANSEVKVSYAK